MSSEKIFTFVFTDLSGHCTASNAIRLLAQMGYEANVSEEFKSYYMYDYVDHTIDADSTGDYSLDVWYSVVLAPGDQFYQTGMPIFGEHIYYKHNDQTKVKILTRGATLRAGSALCITVYNYDFEHKKAKEGENKQWAIVDFLRQKLNIRLHGWYWDPIARVRVDLRKYFMEYHYNQFDCYPQWQNNVYL